MRISPEVSGDLQGRDNLDNDFLVRATYILMFFFFFLWKDRHTTKRKPSNAKYVHLKMYRFLKALANHVENVIQRFLYKWPNPDEVQFASWTPIKPKHMGFTNYFAHCLQHLRNEYNISRLWNFKKKNFPSGAALCLVLCSCQVFILVKEEGEKSIKCQLVISMLMTGTIQVQLKVG